jgi:PPK2 family polyphosphate:nucleotide phosphotransferase
LLHKIITFQKASIIENFDQYRVNAKKFSLKDHNPRDKSERSKSKEQDAIDFTQLATEINALQDILHVEGKRKILLVLQGIDASGKDGTIHHVYSECDPLGIRLASFKAPTSEELAHDFLWRVHQVAPKAGELVIFNRSHYEDVLIVRVHNWIDDAECKRRFAQINDFERLLTETGTTIIKCFLNISKEEQKARMQERLTDPTKTWKFNAGDLEERALWPQYMQAYEQALKMTSTEYAPWYVIPADSKTNRNLLISRLLLDALKGMKLKYPPTPAEYKSITIKD